MAAGLARRITPRGRAGPRGARPPACGAGGASATAARPEPPHLQISQPPAPPAEMRCRETPRAWLLQAPADISLCFPRFLRRSPRGE